MTIARPLLVLFALALLLAPPGFGQEKKKTSFSYDAAGRLVRVDYPNGKALTYDYDPNGNLLKRAVITGVTPNLSIAVKKPAAGVWLLDWNEADGTFTGYGVDTARGFYDLAGTLAVAGKVLTGTINILPEGGGDPLLTFTLAKSKAKADKKTGTLTKLTLKGDNSLKAQGAPLADDPGFAGNYAGGKNQAKVGKVKHDLGAVACAGTAGRTGSTSLTGAVTGLLLRDLKGKAYGVITHDGTDYTVTSKLKDGAKKVKAKTAKGAPVTFQMTIGK